MCGADYCLDYCVQEQRVRKCQKLRTERILLGETETQCGCCFDRDRNDACVCETAHELDAWLKASAKMSRMWSMLVEYCCLHFNGHTFWRGVTPSLFKFKSEHHVCHHGGYFFYVLTTLRALFPPHVMHKASHKRPAQQSVWFRNRCVCVCVVHNSLFILRIGFLYSPRIGPWK